MESIEQVRARLDNIRSIEPILTALRTISLSTLQGALRRLETARVYQAQLREIRRLTLSQMVPKRSRSGREASEASRGCRHLSLLIVGNQRGLCGSFAATVVDAAERALARLRSDASGAGSPEVEVMVLGEHARRESGRRDLEVAWEGSLPVTSVPSLGVAVELSSAAWNRYEGGELDAFEVVYNHYLGAGRYEPRTTRLIPIASPPRPLGGPVWPSPIIETDVHSLLRRADEQLLALSFYQVLLQSTAAEQSSRYQLMDGASENSRRLIEELTLTYQTARQDSVTMEMLELAVSAGLVASEES
jgi:F-type H+-transporting ATPase subunit gamma